MIKWFSIRFQLRESGKPRNYKFACLFVKEFGRNYIKYGDFDRKFLTVKTDSCSQQNTNSSQNTALNVIPVVQLAIVRVSFKGLKEIGSHSEALGDTDHKFALSQRGNAKVAITKHSKATRRRNCS